MGLFSRSKAPVEGPQHETDYERQVLLAQQRAKLRRAQILKDRSAAMAASLSAEGKINNYAWRLRQSAINSIAEDGGTAHAR